MRGAFQSRFETPPGGRPRASRSGPRLPSRCASGLRRLRSRLRLVRAQNLDARGCDENLAEGMHPIAGLVAGADAPAAKLLELLEIGQLDLELQRHAAMTAGQ